MIILNTIINNHDNNNNNNNNNNSNHNHNPDVYFSTLRSNKQESLRHIADRHFSVEINNAYVAARQHAKSGHGNHL